MASWQHYKSGPKEGEMTERMKAMGSPVPEDCLTKLWS